MNKQDKTKHNKAKNHNHNKIIAQRPIIYEHEELTKQESFVVCTTHPLLKQASENFKNLQSAYKSVQEADSYFERYRQLMAEGWFERKICTNLLNPRSLEDLTQMQGESFCYEFKRVNSAASKVMAETAWEKARGVTDNLTAQLTEVNNSEIGWSCERQVAQNNVLCLVKLLVDSRNYLDGYRLETLENQRTKMWVLRKPRPSVVMRGLIREVYETCLQRLGRDRFFLSEDPVSKYYTFKFIDYRAEGSEKTVLTQKYAEFHDAFKLWQKDPYDELNAARGNLVEDQWQKEYSKIEDKTCEKVRSFLQKQSERRQLYEVKRLKLEAANMRLQKAVESLGHELAHFPQVIDKITDPLERDVAKVNFICATYTHNMCIRDWDMQVRSSHIKPKFEELIADFFTAQLDNICSVVKQKPQVPEAIQSLESKPA